MGAQVFRTNASGATMKVAFESAHQEARYEYGFDSGTIAEKPGFKDFGKLPAGTNLRELCNLCIDATEVDYDGHQSLVPTNEAKAALAKLRTIVGSRTQELVDTFDDKWGPAVGFTVDTNSFVFMGWAND